MNKMKSLFIKAYSLLGHTSKDDFSNLIFIHLLLDTVRENIVKLVFWRTESAQKGKNYIL